MQCEDSTALDYYCREPLTAAESCSPLPSCSMLTTCDHCTKEAGCVWCNKSKECVLDEGTNASSECGSLINRTCPKAIPTSEFIGALVVIQDNVTGVGGRLHIEGPCDDCNEGDSYKLQVDEFRMELKSAGSCSKFFAFDLMHLLF